MDERKIQEQVELIRQVFEYIQRFKDKVFVIRIDDTLLDQPNFPLLVKDLVLLYRFGIRIVLVPGATARIDEVLTRYGIAWQTVEGVRVSTPEAIPFIKMAAFDVCNRLMTQLAEHNTDALIGNWVRARGIGVRQGVDFQHSGIVEKINVSLIRNVLQDGLIPIFPNIGWNAAGKPYNISSSELARALSVALEAEKLFFVSRHPGIEAERYRIPPDIPVSPEGLITQLSLEEAGRFLAQNQDRQDDPVLEFVSLAHQAGIQGVQRIHIVNGGIEGVILKEIFSSRGVGTMIYANIHENIRPLSRADIPEVLRIMEPLMERGMLLPRSARHLEDLAADYVVYEVDGIIHACGALHPCREASNKASDEAASGEMAGIAVDQTYAGLGIGKRIISFLLSRARDLELTRVFALTTQSGDWFLQLGFREGRVEDLPPAKRGTYNTRRNSKVLVYDLSRADGRIMR